MQECTNYMMPLTSARTINRLVPEPGVLRLRPDLVRPADCIRRDVIAVLDNVRAALARSR